MLKCVYAKENENIFAAEICVRHARPAAFLTTHFHERYAGNS